MNYGNPFELPFDPGVPSTPDQIMNAPTDDFPLQRYRETIALEQDLALEEIAADSVASVLAEVRELRDESPTTPLTSAHVSEAASLFKPVVKLRSSNIDNQIRAVNRRSDVDLDKPKPGSLSRKHPHFKSPTAKAPDLVNQTLRHLPKTT